MKFKKNSYSTQFPLTNFTLLYLQYLCLQKSKTREWLRLETSFFHWSMSHRPEMCLFPNCSSYSTIFASWCYLWTPLCLILSSQPRIGDNLWLTHNGFSARHKYCWDTSHSYNVMKWVQQWWNRGVMAFTHRDMGMHFTSESL